MTFSRQSRLRILSSSLVKGARCCATKIGSGNVSGRARNREISAAMPPADAMIATAPAGWSERWDGSQVTNKSIVCSHT